LIVVWELGREKQIFKKEGDILGHLSQRNENLKLQTTYT
jgi:hypothetical protein